MTDTKPPTAERVGPQGIGGWLVLPILVLVVTAVSALLQLATFSSLTEAAAGLRLNSMQVLVLSVQVVFNTIIGLIVPLILLYLLFRKDRRFPRLYVGWVAAYLLFVLAGMAVMHIVFGDVFRAIGVDFFNSETLLMLAASLIPVVVFVPYMLTSRRVRNTFVN